MLYAVTPLFNTTGKFVDEFDLYNLRSGAHTIWIDQPDEETALAKAYLLLNRDDRPNGRWERSLSVGDLLYIQSNVQFGWMGAAYIVNPIGFTRLEQDQEDRIFEKFIHKKRFYMAPVG